jgi:hypothetical protein
MKKSPFKGPSFDIDCLCQHALSDSFGGNVVAPQQLVGAADLVSVQVQAVRIQLLPLPPIKFLLERFDNRITALLVNLSFL